MDHRKGGKTVIEYGHKSGSGRKVKKVRRGEDVHGGGGGGNRGEEDRDGQRWNNSPIRREESGGAHSRPPNRVAAPPAPIISRATPSPNSPRTPPKAPPAPNISGQKRPYYVDESDRDRDRSGPYRGGPYRGAPNRGGPNRGGPNRGGPNRGGPNRGGPNRGGPHRGGPYRGGPNRGGPNREYYDNKRARFDDDALNNDRRNAGYEHSPGPSHSSGNSYSNNNYNSNYNNNSNRPREPERFQVPKPDCPLPATIQISDSPSRSSGSPEVVDAPSSPDDGDGDIVVVEQVKKPSDSSNRSSNAVEAPGPRPKSHLAPAGTLPAFKEPSRRQSQENRRSSTDNKRPSTETRRPDVRSSSNEHHRRHERRHDNHRSGSSEKRSNGPSENRRPESNERRSSTENRASSSADRTKDVHSSRPGDRNDHKADPVRRNSDSTEERRSSNDSQRSSSSADPRKKTEKDQSSSGKCAIEKEKEATSKTAKQVSESSKSSEKAGETSNTVIPNETSKGVPSSVQMQLLEKLVSKPGIKEKLLESVKKQLSRSTSHETKKTDLQQSSSSVSGGSVSASATPNSGEKPVTARNTSTETTTVSAPTSHVAPGEKLSQSDAEVPRNSAILAVPKPIVEKVPSKDKPVNKVAPSSSATSQPKAGEQVRGDASRNAVPERVPSTTNVCEDVPIIRPVPLSQITRAIPVDPTKISPSTAGNTTGISRSSKEITPSESRTDVANKQNRPTANQQKGKPTTTWEDLEREASLARAKVASKQPAFASKDELLNILLGKDVEEESAEKSPSENTGASDSDNTSKEMGGNSQSTDPSFLSGITEGDSSPVLPINYNYEIPIPGLDIPPAKEQGSSSVPETTFRVDSAAKASSTSVNTTASNPVSITPRADKPTIPCSSNTTAASTSQTTAATPLSNRTGEPTVLTSVASKNPSLDSVVSADMTRTSAPAQQTEKVSSPPKSKDSSLNIPELLESQPEKITGSPQKLVKLRVNLQLDGSPRNAASGDLSKTTPCDSDSLNSVTSPLSSVTSQQETSRRLEISDSALVGSETVTSGVLSGESVKETTSPPAETETQSGTKDGRECDLREGADSSQLAVTVQQKESTGTCVQAQVNILTEKEPTPLRVQKESSSVRSAQIPTQDAIQSTPEKQQTFTSTSADTESLPTSEQSIPIASDQNTNSITTSAQPNSNADTTPAKSSTAIEEEKSPDASTRSRTACTSTKKTPDATFTQKKSNLNDQPTPAPVPDSLPNPVVVEPESVGSVNQNFPITQDQQSEGDTPLVSTELDSTNKTSKSSTDAVSGMSEAEVPISSEPSTVSPMEEVPDLAETRSTDTAVCSNNVMPETPPLLPLTEEPMEIEIPSDSISNDHPRESTITEEIEEGELVLSDSPLLTPPASSEPSTASVEQTFENALSDALTTERGDANSLSSGSTAVLSDSSSSKPRTDNGDKTGDESTAAAITSLASVPLSVDTNVPPVSRALSSSGSHQDYPVLRIFGNTADIGVQVDMTLESSPSNTESNSVEGIKIRNDVLSSSPPSPGQPDVPLEPTEEVKAKEVRRNLFDRIEKHLGDFQELIHRSALDERYTFSSLQETLNNFLSITERQFSIIDELKNKAFVISHPSSSSPAAAGPANPPVLDPLSLVTVDEMSEYFQALLLIDSVPKRRNSSLQDTLGVHRHRICRILHYLCSLRPGREEASVMNVVNLLYQKFHKLFPNQEPEWTREHVTRCWDAVRLFSGEIDERAIKMDHKDIGPEAFLKKAKMLVQKVQAENISDPANILPPPPPYSQQQQAAAVPSIAPTAAAQLLRPLSPITPPTVNNIPQGVVQNSQSGILASRLAERNRQSDASLLRLNQQQQVHQQRLQQQHQQQPPMQAMSPELARRLSSSQDAVAGMPSPHGSVTQQLQHVVQSIPSPQMQVTHTVHHPVVNIQRQVQSMQSPGTVAQGPQSPYNQVPNIPSPQASVTHRAVAGTPSPHSEVQVLQFSPNQQCYTSQGQQNYYNVQVPEGQQERNNVQRPLQPRVNQQQPQCVQLQAPQASGYQMSQRQAQQLLLQQQHHRRLLHRQMQQSVPQQQHQITPRQTQHSVAQQHYVTPEQYQAMQQSQQQQMLQQPEVRVQQQQMLQQPEVRVQQQQILQQPEVRVQQQHMLQPEVRMQQQQYVQSVSYGSNQGHFTQSSVPVEQGGTLQVQRLQSEIVQGQMNITQMQTQMHVYRQQHHPQIMSSNQSHGSVIAQSQPRRRSRNAQQATYPAAAFQAPIIHQPDVNQQNNVVAPTSTSSVVVNSSNSIHVTVCGAGGGSFVVPLTTAGTSTNAGAVTEQPQQIHPTVRRSSSEGQGLEQVSNHSDNVVNNAEIFHNQQQQPMMNEPPSDDFLMRLLQPLEP